jgi:general secretion pathway protein F
LAESLNDFPKIFPSVYRATIAAGEQSGQLDLVLERLAQYTENRQQLRQKTLLALFYPALLTIVAILVVIGLLTYVVPQVVQVFNNINQQLPWLTLALISLSNFLQNFGIWILVLLITIVFSIRYLLKYNKILFIYHHLLLRLPLISRFERGVNIARFTRTLSILTASGVPVVEALNITSQVISNQIIRKAIEQATKKLNEGSNLNTALKQSGLFPPMTIYLIASGEASGELEAMLERAAIIQEQELETLVAVILSLFEPLLILIMGGIVLIIVLAILMPIFEINQLVR